jgi:hypothetical protein
MKAKLVLYQTNWKQRRRKDPLITCNGLWFMCREKKYPSFLDYSKMILFFFPLQQRVKWKNEKRYCDVMFYMQSMK